MTPLLDPDAIDAIAEAIATRMVDVIGARAPIGYKSPEVEPSRFVDVRELARMFDVSPDTIYRRADELGAIHIGSRLLFDPVDVANRMRRQPPVRAAARTDPPRRRRPTTASAVELLPIRGER